MRLTEKLAVLAAALLLPTAVAAHGGSATVITEPDNGLTVGREFTLSGSSAANCQVGILIDGNLRYAPPSEQGKPLPPTSQSPKAAETDHDGNFELTVDLSGQPVADLANQYQALPAGPHTLTIQPQGCEDAANHTSASLSVTVSDDQSGQAPVAKGAAESPWFWILGGPALASVIAIGLVISKRTRRKR